MKKNIHTQGNKRFGLPGGPNEINMHMTGMISIDYMGPNNAPIYKDKSNIHGDGMFAGQSFRAGDLIGLAHENDQPVTELGRMHNHDGNNPTMFSKKIGNQRYVFANRDLQSGEELTTDYRQQPELEQPENFQAGGEPGDTNPQFQATLDYLNTHPYANMPDYSKLEEYTTSMYPSTSSKGSLNIPVAGAIVMPYEENKKGYMYKAAEVSPDYGGLNIVMINRDDDYSYPVVVPPAGADSKTKRLYKEFNEKYLHTYKDPKLIGKDRVYHIYGQGLPYNPELRDQYKTTYPEMFPEAPAGPTAALPSNKAGGEFVEMDLDDAAIEQYRKMGYTVEVVDEPSYQYGGITPFNPLIPQKTPEQVQQEVLAEGKGPTIEGAKKIEAAKKAQKISQRPIDISADPKFHASPHYAESTAVRNIPKFTDDQVAQMLATSAYIPIDETLRNREYKKLDVKNKYIEALNKYDGGEKEKTIDQTIAEYKSADPTTVKALQEQLMKEGYNLGTYGADGDFGSYTEKALRERFQVQSLDTKTIDKYYQNYSTDNVPRVKEMQQKLFDEGYLCCSKDEIDGKFGPKTKEALEKFNKSKQPDAYFFTNIPKKLDVTECAKGMCRILEQNDVTTEALGVKYRNAWDIKENMDKKGNSTQVYNIYDDPAFKKVKTGDELVKTTYAVKKKSSTTPDMYKPGDIVGIFWPSSTHHDEVLNSKTHNTHVGFVSSVKDGVPMITHNVHGTVKTEPYSNLYTGWIQRPKENMVFDKNYEVETKDAKYNNLFLKNFEKKIERPLNATEKKTVKGVMDRAFTNAENLPKMLNSDVDPKWLQAATVGIAGVETAGGINAPKSKSDYGYAKQAGYWYHDKKDEDISLGVGKIKYSSLDDFSKQYFNINSPKDLADNDKNVDLITYNLIKYHDTFADYAQQFPELKLTEDDIRSMSILAHNRGDKKLLTLGRRSDEYDDSKGKLYYDEIKGLRDISRMGATQKDVSATNWRYAPDFVADYMVDPSETYVSKVKRYIDEVYGDTYLGEQNSENLTGGPTFMQIADAKASLNEYEEGGEFVEMELDSDTIDYYRSLGYRIEEIE